MQQAQAEWVRDSGEWRLAVPAELAKPGGRVTVARADGTRRRTVTIGEVTGREWKGMIVCTIGQGQ